MGIGTYREMGGNDRLKQASDNGIQCVDFGVYKYKYKTHSFPRLLIFGYPLLNPSNFIYQAYKILDMISSKIVDHRKVHRKTTLQSLLAPCFDGQSEHEEESGEEQSAGSVDGRGRVGGAGVDSDDRRAQTSQAVQEAGNTSAGTSVGRREDLRCVGVEHTVHDVLEECLEGREGELEAGVLGEGEDVDEDAGDDGGNGHRALAADVLDVDGDAGEKRAGNADGGGDGVVAVLGVERCALATKVLGQEGVEERVAHTDACPDEPKEDGGGAKNSAVEERADALARELAQVALDNLSGGDGFGRSIGVATDLVKDVLGEPSLATVEVGDAVDDGNGL